jgi:hypothetical protein
MAWCREEEEKETEGNDMRIAVAADHAGYILKQIVVDDGVFLQITCDDATDLPVPGQKYTFGVVKAAQARGDFQVLAERGRRALRVHLGKDVAAGLATLRAAIAQALA